MNYINYFESLLINSICLIFPFTLYLVYVAYIKSFNIKENKKFFTGAIILSLILVLIFNKNDNYHLFTLLSIPLLISYISKKDKLSLLISLFIMFYYNFFFKINITILLLEYSIYYVLYHNLKKTKYFYKAFTLLFLIIKFIFACYVILKIQKTLAFTLNSFLFLTFLMSIIISISLLILHLFTKSKKILDIKNVLEQLEKEQKIKASIFKLNHELKNPLAVCNGYLEMIPDATPTKKEAYLNIIKEEINRSLTIINDFSTLGKIKKLDKEELDLSLLFEDVRDIFTPLYEEKNGKITIPTIDELYINGDYNRLKQVFVNIIKNSLESQNKNTINVDIKIKKVKDNYKITISDNGQGMTKSELAHIEDMFYTTKENGSGIGIPYIKEIISLHKGQINYKSQKNVGTTVTINLPI